MGDCLGMKNIATSRAPHCGKPSAGLGCPLPRPGPRVAADGAALASSRRRGGQRSPRGRVNLALPLTLLRIARPRAPCQAGRARPAAPLPPRVRRRPGNFRREPLPRPAWLGGGRCQMPAGREGGGKAGKRQPQPLRPLPDGHLSRGRGAGGRRRAAAAHGGDRLGSPAPAAPLAPSLRPAQGFPRGSVPPPLSGRGAGEGRAAGRCGAQPGHVSGGGGVGLSGRARSGERSPPP